MAVADPNVLQCLQVTDIADSDALQVIAANIQYTVGAGQSQPLIMVSCARVQALQPKAQQEQLTEARKGNDWIARLSCRWTLGPVCAAWQRRHR